MGAIFSRPSQWIVLEDDCYDVGHTWSASCTYSSLELFTIVFLQAAKIYLPLYIFGDIVRRKSLKFFLTRTIWYVLRSSIFLGINGGGFVTFICLLRKLFGRFYFLSAGYLPGLCSSLCAILTERKSRRGNLSTYVATIALETLYRLMKHRGYVQPLPYGEVMLFCFGSAVLFHSYKSKAAASSLTDFLIGILFKPKIPHKFRKALPGRPGIVHDVLMFIANTTLVSLWSFGLGYAMQTVLNALQLGMRIIKNPAARIKQVLTKPYNRHFSSFVASFAASFKIINALLRLLSVPRDVRLYLSGFFAGLSMLFIRSNAMSLYVFVKALEILYFRGVRAGWLWSHYYGDVVIYSISTAMLFHSALFEAHNLRLSYWRFIDRVTGQRLRDLNYDIIDEYQTDSSQLLHIIEAQEQQERRQQMQRENRTRGGERTTS
ncbi:PREDICTED: transmembrane protein 135-like isoform X1 [Amphimedon queenslandica]|uniref:Transmembrane protein 135 N-terminal domain-containing protein n=1 Tax=Amphimedon queenslandica TaxID=400682 RepID=A0AAN0IW02_AMPQE|nr:PREDICTED: transmembrane protein 135-like isoform X1 [Amphimedon queenslandica]|eukprot:XP_019848646.1 PREDICTED: transmembrane protein 135-like isoform X1 [Amphimedon queenslandica]